MASSVDESRFDALATEAAYEPGADYDLRSTAELVGLMNTEDEAVPAAVAEATGQIVVVIEVIAESLRRGGRLLYVGAGSSGRIAALDAAECESTFAAAPGQVVALVAGGAEASTLEQEAAEDDRAAGRRDLAALDPRPDDIVVGVSASGSTPYVVAALEAAVAVRAATACVVSVPESELEAVVEHPIVVIVGPEFLAGSTRLKAGTAQKLVLNMLSTISMIRLGKTYRSLMVDVVATNEKLRARVRRIVRTATGAPDDEVDAALAAADGEARVAIVSLLAGIGADEARARLDRAGQSIRQAVEG